MADPMRIRAQASGDKATVRVLMSHEMESGQRKDGNGKTIPAWYIQDVTASLNGKVVMTAEWGPAVSKNPFLQFAIKGAKAGDKVAITWKDNKGDSRTDEATVSQSPQSGDNHETTGPWERHETSFVGRWPVVCGAFGAGAKIVDRQHCRIPRHAARREPGRFV